MQEDGFATEVDGITEVAMGLVPNYIVLKLGRGPHHMQGQHTCTVPRRQGRQKIIPQKNAKQINKLSCIMSKSTKMKVPTPTFQTLINYST
jgi:hypothetical protein